MKREWLSKLRKKKRLTQQQIASSSFIDRSYYSQIESGKRNPSFLVAKNLATILEVDPLIFFEDHLDYSNPKISSNMEISRYLRNMENGVLVYLYNNPEKYIRNAITFSLTGIDKDSICIFIDHRKFCVEIKHRLNELLSKNEINHKIFRILQDSDDMINQLHAVIDKFADLKSVYIWSHGYEGTALLQRELANKYQKLNLIMIDCHDSSKIMASTHIIMMREHPFLMTDIEIFASPLYDPSNQSAILPSLYIQEKLT